MGEILGPIAVIGILILAFYLKIRLGSDTYSNNSEGNNSKACGNCNGAGQHTRYKNQDDGWVEERCFSCNGTGRVS
jgi:DnaJ-class molecular chaperone